LKSQQKIVIKYAIVDTVRSNAIKYYITFKLYSV